MLGKLVLSSLWICTYLCSWKHCMAYKENVGSVVKECTRPLNPPHGSYRCSRTESGDSKEECRLVCNKGYVVPITETGKDKALQLRDRGVFHCLTKDGVSFWSPGSFFDCVPELFPTTIYYYARLLMPTNQQTVQCVNRHAILNSTSDDLMKSVQTGKLNNVLLNNKEHAKPDRFEIVAACEGTSNVSVDVSLYFAFKKKYLESSSELTDSVVKAMDSDMKTTLKMSSQTSDSKRLSFGVYYICPRGTWIQQDATCRGCSRGHYLDRKDMNCVPCPTGYYQDEELQSTCKLCPRGNRKHLKTGLEDVSDCFFPAQWITYADVFTILSCLTTVVVTSSLFFYFRMKVTIEPDGISAENYDQLEGIGAMDGAAKVLEDDPLTMEAQMGSGDMHSTISKMDSSSSGSSSSGSSSDDSSSSSSSSSDDRVRRLRMQKKPVMNRRRSSARPGMLAARLYASPKKNEELKTEAYRRISEQYNRKSPTKPPIKKPPPQKNLKNLPNDVDGYVD